MSALILAVLLQYVISVKAGLVNHVQGTANVAALETVRPGHSIKTGVDGYVEILLRPGSFLRLGENSEATLDDADLANVKLTIVRGPAIVEAAEITKDHPITVKTGNLTTKVMDSGIYKFENGVATVLLGKLQTDDAKLTYEKGWQVFFQDNYRARKIGKTPETSLDVYSQSRSETVAMANLSMATALGGSSGYSSFDIWLYSPGLRFYTYIPRSSFRSPYGHKYYAPGGGQIARGYTGTTSDSNGTTETPIRTPVDNSSNSNSAASAPAPVVNTPSGERSTPATYIDSKSSPVGATTR